MGEVRWCVRRWWREQGEGRGGEGRGTSVGGGEVVC